MKVGSLSCLCAVSLILACSQMPDESARPRESAEMWWPEALQGAQLTGPPAVVILSAADSTLDVGGDSTFVFATCYDDSGDPVEEGYAIRFDIVSPIVPGHQSPSFEYRSNYDSVSRSVETLTAGDGVASATIFPGTLGAWVTLKATFASNETVFDQERLIRVLAGPPAHADLAPYIPGENPYEVPLYVLVWDRYTNPVGPGYLIQLDLIPDTVGYIYPDSVYTDSGASATTTLFFSCEHVFDWVTVVAFNADFSDSATFLLAVYDPQLLSMANPQTLILSEETPYAESQVATYLFDIMACRIHGAVIDFFLTGCGQIAGPSTDTTGYEDPAETTFGIRLDEVPGAPGGCTGRVISRLRGYPDCESETLIRCLRMPPRERALD